MRVLIFPSLRENNESIFTPISSGMVYRSRLRKFITFLFCEIAIGVLRSGCQVIKHVKKKTELFIIVLRDMKFSERC
jgi:hypothetical protein